MVNMSLMLSPFSGFLHYLYNGTGYKYFESRAEFKDLGTTVTNHYHSKNVGAGKALKRHTALIQFRISHLPVYYR
jgi:hypothetical protein